MIKVTCKTCGKVFNTIPSRIKFGRGKYCQPKCYWISKKGHTPWNKGKKWAEFSGKNNGNWKGGKYIALGYLYILAPDHPYANKQGYISEHRLVMEKHISRYLTPQEIVHHINGNKQDNRIENLKLFPNTSEHSKHHYPKGKPCAKK